MGAAEWVLLVVLSLLWGGSFFFAKIAVGEVPPLTLALARVALAAAALGTLIAVQRPALPWRRLWWALAGMGFLNNVVPFTLFFWAQTRIPSGLAAILNATTPLFTVALAHRLTRDERMTGNRLAGVAIGFVGVAVMVGPDALAGSAAALLPAVACLLAAFSYAVAGVFGRRFAGLPASAVAAGQLAGAAVLLLPLALTVDRPWTLVSPSPVALGATLALALFSTALAYVLYFRILAASGATNLLLVTFLIPVSALVLGIGILGERLAPFHLVGMALIGAGLAAIDGRALTLLARRRAL
jgi:drug/metabolite transporter (DMT)-like permease